VNGPARSLIIVDAVRGWPVDVPGADLVTSGDYLTAGPTRASDVWSELRADLMPEPGEHDSVLAVIEAGGSLATRTTRRLSAGAGLREVYEELADCLEAGRALV
jgi:hypothetical protein